MDVKVNSDIYLPNTSNSFFFKMFGNMKVSFIMLLLFVILVYIVIFFILGNIGNTNSVQNKTIIIGLEILLWIVLIYVVYINIKNYDIKNFNFQTKMENLFNEKMTKLDVMAKSADDCKKPPGPPGPSPDPHGPPGPKPPGPPPTPGPNNGKEVFHIPDNIFTYDEAKKVCEYYDARLANYDELERSYNNGSNWCSYGWSKDQLALFPTQKSLYNYLKTIPGHEHDCGRPGINGGFFKNKYLKFGVNCYGKKPKPKIKIKNTCTKLIIVQKCRLHP
uniref:Extracellular Link Domain-Containing Protein n=1 Tax=Florenciella sp. virus SA2 TaxID=3240092 RepID=A0AB39J763_9VIRU